MKWNLVKSRAKILTFTSFAPSNFTNLIVSETAVETVPSEEMGARINFAQFSLNAKKTTLPGNEIEDRTLSYFVSLFSRDFFCNIYSNWFICGAKLGNGIGPFFGELYNAAIKGCPRWSVNHSFIKVDKILGENYLVAFASFFPGHFYPGRFWIQRRTARNFRLSPIKRRRRRHQSQSSRGTRQCSTKSHQ